MRYLIVFLMLIIPFEALAVDARGILLQCKPDVTGADFSGPMGNSYASLASNYIGVFPTPEEWAVCKAGEDLERVKTIKKGLVKTQGLELMQEQLPGIDSFETAEIFKEFITSIIPAARDLTPKVQAISDTWAEGSAMLSDINALTTKQQVNDYEIVWP